MTKVVRHWSRLITEVVNALSLEGLDLQGQGERGSEQPDLAVGVPVHCRGIGLDDL